MCAIIDKDVLHESFGKRTTPAGRGFRQWLGRQGSLVLGGRLQLELDQNREFKEWRVQANLAGRVRRIDDDSANRLEAELNAGASLISNDAHVIALAQLGGARLLFSNDSALHRDFKNQTLIDGGKVYSTQRGSAFRDSHRELLRTTACPRRTGGQDGQTS